jgi:NADPH-dependent 2,4-dienoyl-CoA reductase/sulfur reductase-like enzyme/rhodanese-related sulfurtransferase
VLGGVLSGPTAAARAREIDEHAEITILTRESRVSYAAAGIPYHLSGEVRSIDALDTERAGFFKSAYRIDVWTRTEAVEIDPVNRLLAARRNGKAQRVPFDSLVFALGASPTPSAANLDGLNVNTFRNLDHLAAVMESLAARRRRVAVIGAGLHGIATVDGLVRAGAEVTLIEREDSILPVFGPQVSRLAHQALASKVDVRTSATVQHAARKGGRITELELSDGRSIEVDFVILTAGITPSTGLLARAGAHLAPDQSVYVTERAETSLPGIYACGICVSLPQILSGAHIWNAQGSVADKTAQVAGANAAGGRAFLAPVSGSMVRRVLDLTVGRSGLNEHQSRSLVGANFQMTTIHAPSHDAYFPGSSPVLVQIFWDRSTGRVLGAEVAGRSGVDKRIDIVAAALTGNLTIEQLAAIDFGYAPPYGSQRDPLNVAATAAASERAGLARFLTPDELQARLAETQVVDVRTAAEFKEARIPGARSIPLEALRGRLKSLDKKRPVVCYCDNGRRGYLATRILLQHGFADPANLEGGFRSWQLTGLPNQR